MIRHFILNHGGSTQLPDDWPERIAEWSSTYADGDKVNITKTNAILFTKRRPKEPTPIHLEGAVIPWTKEIQYLGLHFTSTLNFNTHMKRTAHNALGRLIQLFPLLARDSSLHPTTKLHLYKTSIRPTMTHAAPVWCSVSHSTYQYLQVIQNNV